MARQDRQLQMPQEFVRPNYKDGSIANIPATIATLLGIRFDGLPPLREALWQPLAGDVKRVVTLVIDGLGLNLLQQERPFLQPLLQQTKIADQLTSIFPSTTVAALSSLWTGVAPAQHSLVGLELFFPEYATIGQLLSFSPTFGRYPDALVEAGLEPESFLQCPGFAQQLARAGVSTHAFKGKGIINSALSKMHGRGVAGNHGVATVTDMLVQMRRLLEATSGDPLYAAAYWPTVDTLGHEYGWTDEAVAAELRSIVVVLQMEFLNRLSKEARRDTVLLIFADHGQIVTPLEERIYIEDHPQLRQMLFMKAAGEPRVVYLYTKHGCQYEAVAYINEHLGHAMIAWRASDVLEAGFFGPQPFAPATAERIGDVIVVMRGGHVLLDSRKNEQDFTSRMRGRHGGMMQAEMIVPWLGMRLDDI